MNLNHSISIVKFIKIGITRINSHDITSYNNQIKKKIYKRYYFSINILQYHVHNRRIISTTKWSILNSLNREEGRKFESLGCWRDSTWKRRRWRAEERWSSFLFIIRGGFGVVPFRQRAGNFSLLLATSRYVRYYVLLRSLPWDREDR